MGHPTPSSWSVRVIPSDDVDFQEAVHLAVMARPKISTAISRPVQDLLDGEARGDLRLRPVVGAYEHNVLRTSIVGVETPDAASNLILIPFELDVQVHPTIALHTLRLIRELSSSYSVELSQVIGPGDESKWDISLLENRYNRLTDLLYLSRSVGKTSEHPSRQSLGRNQHWLTYSASTKIMFCDAIGLSYVRSMDCPELTKIRKVEQSIASHRAAGVFDPSTWFVLAEHDQPLGVLLLNRVHREPVMEIVYMGVSQVARGKGVADLLMDQALRIAAANAASLILAVDIRNDPAKRVYARWNFVEIARRSAWITSLCGIRC